jgi:hypothetical protein
VFSVSDHRQFIPDKKNLNKPIFYSRDPQPDYFSALPYFWEGHFASWTGVDVIKLFSLLLMLKGSVL